MHLIFNIWHSFTYIFKHIFPYYIINGCAEKKEGKEERKE